MKAEELDLRELLDCDKDGGAIRFAGERALILDAVALGILRAELIATVGATIARGVLARFGYAHGWRTAESLRGAFPWDDEAAWRAAGGRLHQLQGLVRVEPVASEVEGPYAEAIWHGSYEADQHLLHVGPSDEPVCWTLCGFASGYLSFAYGREVFCVETECRGRGDAVCRVVGKPIEEWGDRSKELLAAYKREGIEGCLRDVTQALKRAERRLRAKRRALGPDVAEDPSGVVARSGGMRRALELARRIAAVDASVLLTGESGVGKERLARVVHDASPRAAGPFVAVNCAAVAESLLESELFGHARGAFTGAVQDRPGLFEAATRGTLFLDEIGDVSAGMQAKLLRTLEEKEVRRVGENKSRPVDARIVSATNRDLAADVAAGRFRQDLYYRLKVVEIAIPPLRERPEDVIPLARVLLAETAGRLRRKVDGFTPDAAGLLLRYPWPGNVRELKNAIERAVALADGERIDAPDLPDEVRAAPARASPAPGERARTLEDVERAHVLAVLAANGGNQAKTAKELAIGTATLYRKLRRWGAGEAPRRAR